MIATSKMMNGVERTALMIQPSTLLKIGIGCTPPLSVTCSKMPNGMPKTDPMKPDKPTMMTVSTNESQSMSIRSEDMACDLLNGDVVLAQIFEQLRESVGVAARQNRECAKAFSLHFVDLPQQNIDVDIEHAAGF